MFCLLGCHMMMSGNDRKLRVTSVSNPACGTQSVSSTCWIRNTPCIFANVSTTYDFHIERYSLCIGHGSAIFNSPLIRASSALVWARHYTDIARPMSTVPLVVVHMLVMSAFISVYMWLELILFCETQWLHRKPFWMETRWKQSI